MHSLTSSVIITKTALLIKRVQFSPTNLVTTIVCRSRLHAQTCQGLPRSVHYVVLTVAAKCRHFNTKFRINLFGVSRAVSCVQTDSKMKVALRRAATGPNITLLHRQTLPYCPRCGSNTSSYSDPHLPLIDA